MAVDLKQDWPVVAAVGAGIAGLYLLARGGGGPGYTVQETSTQGASQVAQAYLAAQAQQEQAVSGALSTYLNYLAEKDQTAAYTNIAEYQALTQEYATNAAANYAGEQLQTQEAAIHAQQQTSLWQGILNFLSGVANLFGKKG